MPTELDQAIRELNWAMYRLGILETAIKGLKWPPTRRAQTIHNEISRLEQLAGVG